jgi:hypothetical protein
MTTETPAMEPQNRSGPQTTDEENIYLQTYATGENCAQRLHRGQPKMRHFMLL